MLGKLVRSLPPGVIQSVSVLQHRFPALKPLFRRIRSQVGTTGTVENGPGRGLTFDTTGGPVGLLYGTVDPEEQSKLVEVLKPGQTFFDVGANIGIYAAIAARHVGPEGSVHAFEPDPEALAAARSNCGRNGLENVHYHQTAIGATIGTARFVIGDSSTTSNLRDNATGQTREVPVTTLDQLRLDKTIPAPDVVMIDVEGAELDVLRGMQGVLRASRPALMIEVHWLGAEFVDYIEQELVPLGYRAGLLMGGPLPRTPERYHALLIAEEKK
jgi:FkbM family methyltransferase